MKTFEKPWEVKYATIASSGTMTRSFAKENEARRFYKGLRRRRDVCSMQIVNVIDYCVEQIVDAMLARRGGQRLETDRKLVKSILLECLR